MKASPMSERLANAPNVMTEILLTGSLNSKTHKETK